MKRIRIAGLALLAVLSLGVVVATAAQAAEAPFYSIESKRLGAGETQAVTLTQTASYTLTAGTTVITCVKSGANNSIITGSAAGEPGTSSGTVSYSGCTVAGNGSTCKVGHEGKGEILTEKLKDELVYDATSKESKSVADEFTPETGKVLAKVTFSGAGCEPLEQGVIAVEGQAVAQVYGGTTRKEFLLELGKAPVLATTGTILFPEKKISSVILFKAGVGTQTAITLKFGASPASLAGESEVKLSSGKKWCVIS